MLIAQQKRKENIAEYLLYMWQVEDLLRACQLNPDKIEQLLVARFAQVQEVDGQLLQTIRTWYTDLCQMMLTEGKREHGHLQINDNIIIDLTDLHQQLLKNGKDALYTSVYYATLPYIVELRSKEGEQPAGELETCFTALYGLLMLRLQGKDVSQETTAAMQQISKFVARLTEKYHLWKKGELEEELAE